MRSIHKSVLLNETIDALELKEGMVVVDATLGGGGHSREILKKIGNSGTLVVFDRDIEAIEKFTEKITNEFQKINDKISKIGNILLVNENFANLGEILNILKIKKVDAIVADLGISSDQLDDARRGLSFQADADLDMRLDRSQQKTAADVVNSYSAKELTRVLREFGDERFAARIVQSIVSERTQSHIASTKQLAQIVTEAVPGAYRHGKIHPATKTFQALRIEVNGELEAVKEFIPQAIDALAPKGRLAMIAFHSGEDSIVKHMLKDFARGCICPPEFPVCRCGNEAKVKILTSRPIVASEKELEENPRARSAKLRVAEKI